MLNYLDGATAFLVERGSHVDLIDGAEDVPAAFHTDGAWIWPADVAHYLRKHRITPHAELVDRIRGRNFLLPDVDDATVAEAEATITGRPVRLPPLEQRLAAGEREVLAKLESDWPPTGFRSMLTESAPMPTGQCSPFSGTGDARCRLFEGVWQLSGYLGPE